MFMKKCLLGLVLVASMLSLSTALLACDEPVLELPFRQEEPLEQDLPSTIHNWGQTGTGVPQATGMIRNDSKDVMNATVRVEFFDSTGASLGIADTSVKGIQPGADAKWTTDLLQTNQRAASCKISQIMTSKAR